MNDEAVRYHHTQIGTMTLLGMLFGALTQMGAAVQDMRAGRKRVWSYLPGMLTCLVGSALFSSLTVEVDEREISAAFTFGFLRRRVPLTEVTAAEVITVPWYAGWGLRYWRGGWLYSVWGRRALRLSLADGRALTIGTDQPELLLAQVQGAQAALAT
jgi:hypothetical protein